jgi:environmental stress-induced protein Ves
MGAFSKQKSMKIFNSAARETINWSGGTSTQLFVYPESASFAERNFDFRFSTATVEVEATDFTHFPGIDRHLMILEGELELTHHGRYTKLLRPYDTDHFSGDWKSSSKGKVRDLNLMLRNGYTGSVHAFLASPGEKHEFHNELGQYELYYLHRGKISHADGSAFLNEGDLLVMSPQDTTALLFVVQEPMELLQAKIQAPAL